MAVTHFKRLTMEIDTCGVDLPEPLLPDGYEWSAWHPSLVGQHAQAKFESFRDEMDCELFDCLSHLSGCRRLMTDISLHDRFLPSATWLIQFVGNRFLQSIPCATIQGLRNSPERRSAKRRCGSRTSGVRSRAGARAAVAAWLS